MRKDEIVGEELRLFLKEGIYAHSEKDKIVIKWKEKGKEKTVSIPKKIINNWDVRIYTDSDLWGLEFMKLFRKAIRNEILRALAVEREKEIPMKKEVKKDAE